MRYELDPDRSRLTIHASSTLHPIITGAPVTGWLDVTLDDGGHIDTGAPVDGLAEVAIGEMRSGNPLIDREAERRLQVRRFPVVAGRLTALTAADGDGYDGTGTLDFHGVTHPLEGVLRVEHADAGALVLDGDAELDVTDFGVQPPSLLVVKVHARVRVELHAVAVPTT